MIEFHIIYQHQVLNSTVVLSPAAADSQYFWGKYNSSNVCEHRERRKAIVNIKQYLYSSKNRMLFPLDTYSWCQFQLQLPVVKFMVLIVLGRKVWREIAVE